jgi:peptide-methionine (S)-S-oxide reductase
MRTLPAGDRRGAAGGTLAAVVALGALGASLLLTVISFSEVLRFDADPVAPRVTAQPLKASKGTSAAVWQELLAAAPGRSSIFRVREGGIAMAKATFGAGCFWGVEETFRVMPGVLATAVGYEGGALAEPTYEQVCSDRSGHAEVVEIDYDPNVVSYDQLLDVFWKNHDPTTLDRQGPDMGRQYRSAIFFHSPEQEAAAIASRGKLSASGRYRRPIVTEITPAQTFWRAEEYHQQYLHKRGATSCHF